MAKGPRITKMEVHQFAYERNDMARGERSPEYSPATHAPLMR